VCWATVVGQKRETDAVKLISVRAGMIDMSQNWENMGKKCMLLAQAQKVSLSSGGVVGGWGQDRGWGVRMSFVEEKMKRYYNHPFLVN